MDDKWLGRALNWAAARVEGLPEITQARTDIHTRDFASKARASIVLALEAYETEHRRHAARWQLANACRTFAAEAEQRGDELERRDWLVVGALLFRDLASGDERYAPSLKFCADRLRDLGAEDWLQLDPVPAESAPAHSVSYDDPDVWLGAEEEAPPSAGVPVREASAAGEPDRSVQPVVAVAATGIDPDSGRDHDLEALVARWHGPLAVLAVLPYLESFLLQELTDWPILMEGLGPMIQEDLAQLKERLADAGLQRVGDDVLARAREARGLATAQGVTPRTEAWVRQRWLLASAINYALWQELDWATNRPQVVLDLLGYVTAVQISRRFNDSDRELLLASHEFVVQTGASLPRAFHRFPFVRAWVTSAFGTYLLLGGPEPAIPSESLTDDRIIGERRTAVDPQRGYYEPGREERQRWAQRLLRLWRFDENTLPSAAFTVASACGWDSTVTERLLALVFSGTGGEAEDDRAFWQQQAEAVVNRAHPIRIASNPWAPQSERRSSSGIISTDPRTNQLLIPDSVLKAMVSQVVDEDWSVTVQGEGFRGRRVPTYVLINQFGAFGVLKLDYADRVAREKANFEAYARTQLRPQHRPSECRAGSYRLYVGDQEEPLQALLTSYVFEDDEEPATLAVWMVNADPGDIQDFFSDRLADKVIYPWLSQVRRDVIDVRMPYPVLRSRVADSSEYAPDRWARPELRRLVEDERVTAPLGVALGWDEPNFSAAAAELAKMIGVDVPDTPDGLVNPLWVAAGVAELRDRTYEYRLYSSRYPLTALNTLLTINHGDFHADNILVTNATSRHPKAVLIDFETTHETHICRDFSRLEASLLCQVFDWSDDEAAAVLNWMAGTFEGEFDVLCANAAADAGINVRRATEATAALRLILHSCQQPRWPLRAEEYGLALLSALLPLVRNTNTMNDRQRAFALLLASQVASFVHQWLTKGERDDAQQCRAEAPTHS